MASAQVTVKITPYELQLINEGLQLLAKITASHIEGKTPDLKVNWSLTDGDARQMVHEVNLLKRNLGIK